MLTRAWLLIVEKPSCNQDTRARPGPRTKNGRHSKSELQSQLQKLRISCTSNHTKEVAIHVAVWIKKLGVVRNIERFDSELKNLAFSNVRVFKERHVEIVEARTGEEAAVSVSELADGFGGEVCRVEIGLAGAWILVDEEKSVTGELRMVDSNGSSKGVVVVLRKRDGKTGGEGCDARQRPARRNSPGEAVVGVKELVEFKVEIVADHEILCDVERTSARGSEARRTVCTIPQSADASLLFSRF